MLQKNGVWGAALEASKLFEGMILISCRCVGSRGWGSEIQI